MMTDEGWRVLVVDDEPNNLKLMRQILSEDYRLAFAPSGSTALDIVEKVRPDLILLDIMMPEMDGYEVCRRLKADPCTRDIPVIFVTAKSEASDETTGFDTGAVDYITKPVSPPIVKARVKNHLELKRARERLKNQNAILEQRVAERTREVLALQQVEFELRAAREKVAHELNIAARIQQSILPSTFPAFPEHREFDLFAVMTPAREVGGDFYDFFFIDDNRLAVIIADVSGKGVPAALFMMNSRTVFRSIAIQGKSPAEVLAESNDILCIGNDTGMFVSAFIAYYHFSSGRLVYSNGGHNPPLLLQSPEACRELDQRHGSALGVLPGIVYGEDVQRLEQGQMLVLYTDGVTEACSPEKELFGLARFQQFVNSCRLSDPSHLCHRLVESLEEFQQGPQFDDITVLALKREV
jgi:serine phosphatase RsbU (regulator of sigma subunit)